MTKNKILKIIGLIIASIVVSLLFEFTIIAFQLYNGDLKPMPDDIGLQVYVNDLLATQTSKSNLFDIGSIATDAILNASKTTDKAVLYLNNSKLQQVNLRIAHRVYCGSSCDYNGEDYHIYLYKDNVFVNEKSKELIFTATSVPAEQIYGIRLLDERKTMIGSYVIRQLVYLVSFLFSSTFDVTVEINWVSNEEFLKHKEEIKARGEPPFFNTNEFQKAIIK